jgi:two-component system, LuxR family, sensor kinase FixL
MLEFFSGLLRADFLPHGWCYRWDPEVVWLHVTSDLLIALAYYFIPFSLIYIVRKRGDLVYPWMFWLFGAFILACGTTHLMNVLVVWQPWYRLDGMIKAVTALASVPTAIVLLRLSPAIIALPSPEQLRLLNRQLEQEVADRREAEEQVRRLNAELEQRVADRTRELRESEERMRAILDSAPLLVYLKDREGRFLFVNSEFARSFNLDTTAVLGKTGFELFPAEAAQAYADVDETVWNSRQAVEAEEKAFHHGAMHTYMSVKFLLFGEDGRPYALCGLSADITERKQAEQELQRHTADLEQFAFLAAHDLLEPLRNVKNYAQLLQRRYSGKLDERAEEYIGFITGGVDRMYQLVDGLRSYTEFGRKHPAEVLDPARILQETLTHMETTLAPSGARVEFRDMPAVRANENELSQVFQNLIANAVKYRSDAPPLIRVTAARKGVDVEFSVKDNGIGIDMAYADQIFGVFRRLHGKDVPGTGIGLAIVKRIVESHGGTIRVVSSPGEGADFRFTLPAA